MKYVADYVVNHLGNEHSGTVVLQGEGTPKAGDVLDVRIVYSAAWLLFRYSGRRLTDISSGYLLVFPVAACLIVYSMLRSMAVTLAREEWSGVELFILWRSYDALPDR
jgi:hypothetical protein